MNKTTTLENNVVKLVAGYKKVGMNGGNKDHLSPLRNEKLDQF